MRRVFQFLAIALAAGATGLILFLGLMPRPDLVRLDVLPTNWARFIDQQYTLRHVAGFFVFHLLLVSVGVFAGGLTRFRRRLALAAALSVFALVLELAQIALPHRSVNFEDILASWAGITLAFVLFEGAKMLRDRARKPSLPPHAD